MKKLAIFPLQPFIYLELNDRMEREENIAYPTLGYIEDDQSRILAVWSERADGTPLEAEYTIRFTDLDTSESIQKSADIIARKIQINKFVSNGGEIAKRIAESQAKAIIAAQKHMSQFPIRGLRDIAEDIKQDPDCLSYLGILSKTRATSDIIRSGHTDHIIFKYIDNLERGSFCKELKKNPDLSNEKDRFGSSINERLEETYHINNHDIYRDPFKSGHEELRKSIEEFSLSYGNLSSDEGLSNSEQHRIALRMISECKKTSLSAIVSNGVYTPPELLILSEITGKKKMTDHLKDQFNISNDSFSENELRIAASFLAEKNGALTNRVLNAKKILTHSKIPPDAALVDDIVKNFSKYGSPIFHKKTNGSIDGGDYIDFISAMHSNGLNIKNGDATIARLCTIIGSWAAHDGDCGLNEIIDWLASHDASIARYHGMHPVALLCSSFQEDRWGIAARISKKEGYSDRAFSFTKDDIDSIINHSMSLSKNNPLREMDARHLIGLTDHNERAWSEIRCEDIYIPDWQTPLFSRARHFEKHEQISALMTVWELNKVDVQRVDSTGKTWAMHLAGATYKTGPLSDNNHYSEYDIRMSVDELLSLSKFTKDHRDKCAKILASNDTMSDTAKEHFIRRMENSALKESTREKSRHLSLNDAPGL